MRLDNRTRITKLLDTIPDGMTFTASDVLQMIPPTRACPDLQLVISVIREYGRASIYQKPAPNQRGRIMYRMVGE